MCWLAQAILRGRCAEAASHRIVFRFGSATIGRRHIDDLCTSVRIPEDHCSSFARHSALLRYRSARIVLRLFTANGSSCTNNVCRGAAGPGHKGDLPAISEGSHCAIADRDRNPARASALATMGNDWETVCVICIPARKYTDPPACREFFGRAVSRHI